MSRQRVAVGMSGGVDSSLAACLLKEQGYEVTGVYLECWNDPQCRSDQDKKDALRVALDLAIPFEVLDFRKNYTLKVVEYFYRDYARGVTPNPDVVCNREIKFGLFYDWMEQNGFDYMATGHYARIFSFKDKTDGQYLQRARDENKDQSYFLWQVEPEKLSRVLFPLGEIKKNEVREMALARNLVTAKKPDSMGICFIGEVDVSELLKNKLGEKTGPVVIEGHDTIVGRHQGIWFYTVGQRVGVEIDKHLLSQAGIDPTRVKPLYVKEKRMSDNTLVLDYREQVYGDTFRVFPQWYLSQEEIERLVAENGLFVRVRNLGELVPCELETGSTPVKVKTKNKLFALAPGQSAVFYGRMGRKGQEIVVGGGEII